MTMRGARRGECELCGLRRICFPGRLTAQCAPGTDPLRIRCIRVARGHALYRAGEPVGAFHMVRSGCIKELDAARGQDAIVNFCLPGELLTVQAASTVRSLTSSIAVDTSFVCAIPWRVFQRVCAQSPAVTAEFIKMIAKTGGGTRELLTLIRGKGALERLAGFLWNLRARLQSRGLPARDIRLGMSRDDIAGYLGMRSETVSRCFSELERRELIKVRAKRIEILAPERVRGLSLADTGTA